MPMFRYFLAVTIVAMLFEMKLAIAQENTAKCQITDEVFFKQLSIMKNWKTIYAIFKSNFPGCPDDGVYGEGYSDVVVRAFANQWHDTNILKTLTDNDPAFRKFLIQHVNATANTAELKQVLENVKNKCPTDLNPLCNEVANQVTVSLEEINKYTGQTDANQTFEGGSTKNRRAP